MRTCEIQTGPGKIRTVWIVEGRERRAYVRLARKLAKFERDLAERNGVADVAHGFVSGRSPVTMASAHIGYDVTVSLDLKDWFESVSFGQLRRAGIRDEWYLKIAPGGVVRQGLPTSPAAANIAGVALDRAIMDALSRRFFDYAYTRYADDMTVSYYLPQRFFPPSLVIDAMEREVTAQGWQLNYRKTRIQYASAGRRIICGLSVGETDVRATRDVRHRLRACRHARPGTPETRGLSEWAACKLPGSRVAAGNVNRVLSFEE